ncbi:MAG: MmgE/PrpD family protein, partial [Gemmatimonadota bacterium]|nr:MmgE/PrpD family protein [Gemmatimonadota bacterium]
MESLTRRLVRLVRTRPASSDALVDAERYVRDWLGSFVAGAAEPTGHMLEAYADGARDLESRTFLASALSHVTETDDLHNASVTHPGCVVIPVALLLGRQRVSRGHAALRATLVGYEVMTRIGEALGPTHYRTFHNTATAGVFGSAAAAASLLELDEDAWVWALGNAGTLAAGLWQFNVEGAMSKPLHAGHASSTGLRAALLAAQGLTGAEMILEGEKGLFAALCADARPDAVLADGPTWKLPETSMKPYPCCRHVHSAIDAALEVRHALGGARPARVRVESYPAAMECTDRLDPRSPQEARFSIQYAVASTLLRGPPGLETFTPAAIRDPDVQAVLAQTSVECSPALTSAYPQQWGARVHVEATDGTRRHSDRDAATGDPDRPLDDAALDAKVSALFSWAGLDDSLSTSLLRQCRLLTEDGPVFGLPAHQGAR